METLAKGGGTWEINNSGFGNDGDDDNVDVGYGDDDDSNDDKNVAGDDTDVNNVNVVNHDNDDSKNGNDYEEWIMKNKESSL